MRTLLEMEMEQSRREMELAYQMRVSAARRAMADPQQNKTPIMSSLLDQTMRRLQGFAQRRRIREMAEV